MWILNFPRTAIACSKYIGLTMKMETVISSQTSVTSYQTTRCHNTRLSFQFLIALYHFDCNMQQLWAGRSGARIPVRARDFSLFRTRPDRL